MRRGFLYLVAVIDWATRKVLAWRLSNTMEADFCVAALKDAMDVHGRPEIFNTDQGSQFTGHAFTGQAGGRGHTHLDGRVPDAGWTRCLSNGCGARSNTNACS
jgi:putative transposase